MGAISPGAGPAILYAILVSEFMLQQTQVATVIPYYHKWLRTFPDFASLARASENEVLRAWQGLGYYARARNLHATAKTVMDRHGGNFPRRNRANATTFRNREIHRARSGQLCV